MEEIYFLVQGSADKPYKLLFKKIAAFSDWQQPWMDNCDGQMGRKLLGLFEGSKKFRAS